MSLRRKSLILILILLVLFLSGFSNTNNIVYADELFDNMQDQINNLDLGQLEDFFNENVSGQGYDFFAVFSALLKGEYAVDYSNIFQYFAKKNQS